MEKVGLGVIGLGWWGSTLARAAEESGVARVVSCFARRPEGKQTFAETHACRQAESLESLLDDPEVEAVLIATSHQTHRKMIEAAAAAGKHVFVEKPLTNSLADGIAAVEATEEANVLLQVGYQRRRMPAKRRIKEMLDAGELGDVETVIAHQSVPNAYKMPAEAWRWDPDQSPLGAMTSLGVHKIDTMHYLIGPISQVFALTRPGRNTEIDEATVLALEFESGALATLTTSFFTPVVNEIAVFGTQGAAYSSGGGERLRFQGRGDPGPTEIELQPLDPIVDEIAAFAAAIRGESPVEVDGAAGLAVVAVMEAAVQSAQQGVPVPVPAVGKG